MRAFRFEKQQHPEGGVTLTLSVHCGIADLDVMERMNVLADVLATKVTPAPEPTRELRISEPEGADEVVFYNGFDEAGPPQLRVEESHGPRDTQKTPRRGPTSKR